VLHVQPTLEVVELVLIEDTQEFQEDLVDPVAAVTVLQETLVVLLLQVLLIQVAELEVVQEVLLLMALQLIKTRQDNLNMVQEVVQVLWLLDHQQVIH
jgi:hypothetical protein